MDLVDIQTIAINRLLWITATLRQTMIIIWIISSIRRLCLCWTICCWIPIHPARRFRQSVRNNSGLLSIPIRTAPKGLTAKILPNWTGKFNRIRWPTFRLFTRNRIRFLYRSSWTIASPRGIILWRWSRLLCIPSISSHSSNPWWFQWSPANLVDPVVVALYSSNLVLSTKQSRLITTTTTPLPPPRATIAVQPKRPSRKKTRSFLALTPTAKRFTPSHRILKLIWGDTLARNPLLAPGQVNVHSLHYSLIGFY